jgi:hypothetical protein
VQRNEEREAETKYNQGNQQVDVGEDCLGLLEICHPHPIRSLWLNLGKHIGVAIPLSTRLLPRSDAGSAKWPEED